MTYVELCCRSFYSFLEGASSPEALVEHAAKLKMSALGLVDRNGLYGALAFYQSCRELGIKPVIGAQVTVEDDEIYLYCTNATGYTELSQLLTEARRGRSKDEARVTYQMLEKLSSGAIIAVVGAKVGLLPTLVMDDDERVAKEHMQKYAELLGSDNLYIGLAHHHEAGDTVRCQRLAALAREMQLPTIATNSPSYATEKQGRLHDVLLCIKSRVTLNDSHPYRSGNHHRHLKDDETMKKLFSDYPEALENTLAFAERCNVSLDFSSYRVPDFPVPDDFDHNSYLAHLCSQKVSTRYPDVTEAVWKRLRHELELIASLKLSGYFLVVWDLVEFARKKGIPVQGRGSAANSIVTYILGITPVDPIANKLFLGRFLHEGMTEAPDIDLDFAATRDASVPDREDVIQYVYERYGQDHVAMVCTFVTFKARSAIREVGTVLEIPEHLIDKMARMVNRYGMRDVFTELEKTPELNTDFNAVAWQHFKEMVEQIADIPRHVSIHVGGMLIASRPIAELVPLEPARMAGRVVCQWDKDMVADAGLIKVDILSLGMLGVLREAQNLANSILEAPIDLDVLEYNDGRVFDMISRADTVGAFQVESRAQMQSLPRTQPRTFEELGVQVAIIRPGPLQGNMVSPYIKRKQGFETVSYMHPSLKPILEDTLGVILFQEQVLQAAVAVAGFTPSQAADLRRAMNRKRSQEAMARLKGAFMEGAKKQGVHPYQAERVFSSLEGFALYGFCKSHALSFARITYLSTWLKVYQPAAFLAALLNNQPMGFYPIKTLIDDSKRHGVIVHDVDVNVSVMRCHLTDATTVQLGFNMIKGLKDETAQNIVSDRVNKGTFTSLRNFVQRTHPTKQSAERLVQAGACDSFGLDRREQLWQLWLLQRGGLFLDDLFGQHDSKAPQLQKSDAWDRIRGEYSAQGFSAQLHPIALLRPQLQGVTVSKELHNVPNDSPITVAGVVVCRQKPPTAKGFAFLTLEDEYGMMNIIISPQVYEKTRMAFRQAAFVEVLGTRTEFDGVINIHASSISAL